MHLTSPGDTLVSKFANPRGLTVRDLSEDLHIPIQKIVSIIAENHRITADIALRLGRYFGTAPEFWMDLQSEYDLEKAKREVGRLVEEEVLPLISATAAK